MRIIGLCGGSGSGKGAVSAVFRKYGIPTVDTDIVYREITSYMSDCLIELKGEFGDSIVNGGALDRRALAALVFSDTSRLQKLNAIAHKHILARTREILASFSESGSEVALVEAPLLFEAGLDSECDLTVAVIADYNVRLARIIARDSISEDEARQRLSSQRPDEWLISNVDEVIYNNGDLGDLESSVLVLIDKIKKYS